MIIAFAGRLRSGKTELAKICEKYGFIRLYFALPLKQLIADLLNTDINGVLNLKNTEINFQMNEEQITHVSNVTSIPIEVIKPLLENKIFKNTREMMQYIGTDIIRTYNANWHVDKINDMIDITKNYVIDDLRFVNEKEMIEKNNGIMFFVVRPYLAEISSHESENTLKWQNFSNIIVNDNNLEKFKFKWETFMSNGFVQSMINRARLLNTIQTDEKTYNKFINSNDEMSMYNMLFINKCEFTYDAKFLNPNIQIDKLENFNNCLFRVYYPDGNIEIVTNPLMIEDLKFIYIQKQKN